MAYERPTVKRVRELEAERDLQQVRAILAEVRCERLASALERAERIRV